MEISKWGLKFSKTVGNEAMWEIFADTTLYSTWQWEMKLCAINVHKLFWAFFLIPNLHLFSVNPIQHHELLQGKHHIPGT